ncbi:MAG TPA: hypothetical protein VN192_04175 [Flavobacterium sp.]|nr:hypothetical protein [Flavobacterium sp.]
MEDLLNLNQHQIKALQAEVERLNKENIKNLAKLQTATDLLHELYNNMINEIDVKE